MQHPTGTRRFSFRAVPAAFPQTRPDEVPPASEPAVHQSCQMIVREFLWRVTWEKVFQLYPKHLHEVFESIVQDELQTGLNLGNPTP